MRAAIGWLAFTPAEADEMEHSELSPVGQILRWRLARRRLPTVALSQWAGSGVRIGHAETNSPPHPRPLSRGGERGETRRWRDISKRLPIIALLLFALILFSTRADADPGVGHAPLIGHDEAKIELVEGGAEDEPGQVVHAPPQYFSDDSSNLRIGFFDADRNQFILARSGSSDRVPFELTFELITQLRYTGFNRSSESWVDSAGVVNPVSNISVFEINRNWFEFSGYALDPNLQFRTVVFTSTSSSNAIFLGYVRYEFDEAFRINGGYWKVPGTREWANSFRYTLGVDRTMATTFFRPGFSPGIWIDGELDSGLSYIAMIANSISGESETANRIGTNMVYSSSLQWEPWGKFGPGPSDIEDHSDAALRLGSIVTFTRKVNQGVNDPANPEDTIVRLSDGTPLFNFQSLGPGTQLNAANFLLWTVDAGIKWRGLSLTAEYYFRWLNQFSYSGPAPERSHLFDHGGYVQGGAFLIPKTLEGYARTSTVGGPFGRGYEWSLGVNWFPRNARTWRVSFDVTRILHSPADNILTGYRAGESGTLFQAQMLVDF